MKARKDKSAQSLFRIEAVLTSRPSVVLSLIVMSTLVLFVATSSSALGENPVTAKRSPSSCTTLSTVGHGRPLFGNSNLGKDFAPFFNPKKAPLFSASNLGTGILMPESANRDCANEECDDCDFGCTPPCTPSYCTYSKCGVPIVGNCRPAICQLCSN